jgi:hypothetical protein
VQRWVDDNRDGRADRVAVYQGDRVVRVIRWHASTSGARFARRLERAA